MRRVQEEDRETGRGREGRVSEERKHAKRIDFDSYSISTNSRLYLTDNQFSNLTSIDTVIYGDWGHGGSYYCIFTSKANKQSNETNI